MHCSRRSSKTWHAPRVHIPPQLPSGISEIEPVNRKVLSFTNSVELENSHKGPSKKGPDGLKFIELEF